MLRQIAVDDLPRITRFEYSVSIVEAHSEIDHLSALHAASGLWSNDAGAVAIVANDSGLMVGTLQYYVGAPCIHGIELGYVVHNPSDRGKGYATEALRLFSDFLFSSRPLDFRHQLVIEVWNTASWKVAERSGFLREGVLRSSGFGVGDPADSFIYSRTRRDHFQEQHSQNGHL